MIRDPRQLEKTLLDLSFSAVTLPRWQGDFGTCGHPLTFQWTEKQVTLPYSGRAATKPTRPEPHVWKGSVREPLRKPGNQEGHALACSCLPHPRRTVPTKRKPSLPSRPLASATTHGIRRPSVAAPNFRRPWFARKNLRRPQRF